MIAQVMFAILLALGIGLFTRNVRRIIGVIRMGTDVDRNDRKKDRWAEMIRVALGQSKMVRRPVAGFFHILIYVGFVIINIEVIEILIDGLAGTHRVFASAGMVYNVLIGSFEVLAALVVVACVVFLFRRYAVHIKRFWSPEMKGWPTLDATLILVIELVLMGAFLTMNAADGLLQHRTDLATHMHYHEAGSFPISQWLMPFFSGWDTPSLYVLERSMWWIHIAGILAFLNYLVISKHFHIIMAFPNVWYSNLEPKGAMNNMDAVTEQVKLMMDPNADPYAAAPEGETPSRFGAADVMDLNWVQLMNAYTCTECGRCTSECPANATGKKLSPRKIMMDTRDRLEDVKEVVAREGKWLEDGKTLLDDYISREEIWACTTCNACVEACPVGIDPLSIIAEMRRYVVMEEGKAPVELNSMMTNIENNGAPWAFPAADRLKWAEQ